MEEVLIDTEVMVGGGGGGAGEEPPPQAANDSGINNDAALLLSNEKPDGLSLRENSITKPTLEHAETIH